MKDFDINKNVKSKTFTVNKLIQEIHTRKIFENFENFYNDLRKLSKKDQISGRELSKLIDENEMEINKIIQSDNHENVFKKLTEIEKRIASSSSTIKSNKTKKFLTKYDEKIEKLTKIIQEFIVQEKYENHIIDINLIDQFNEQVENKFSTKHEIYIFVRICLLIITPTNFCYLNEEYNHVIENLFYYKENSWFDKYIEKILNELDIKDIDYKQKQFKIPNTKKHIDYNNTLINKIYEEITKDQ
ncbi:hypothetical protein HDV06_006562 [Boothiomyces sp. JEL0866]|nr:hypothetical protein HDV06_006562 [Boothiomyces sp. JEL0866]